MRTIRLGRGSWVIAAICAFALAAAFLGYGAVSATSDPPAAPASLSAVRHDGNIEIRFNHPNVANVDSWQVQTRARNAAWGDWSTLADVGPNAINAYIDGTDNDTDYRIRLRAVNEHGAGAYVKTVARSVNRAAVPDNIRVAAHGDDILRLVWNTSDDEAITGYEYKMRAAGDAWDGWYYAGMPADASGSQYISFSDLESDTKYQFRLRAMRGSDPGYVGKANGRTEISNDVSE